MPVECERIHHPRKPGASVGRNVMASAVNASGKQLSGRWTYIACNEYVVGLAREAAGYSLADFVH